MTQTCVGILQGVYERLDGWYIRRTGHALSRLTHGAIVGVAVLASGRLSNFGIVALVAKGYGTMAWGFLLIFIVPLTTVGVYQLVRTG